MIDWGLVLHFTEISLLAYALYVVKSTHRRILKVTRGESQKLAHLCKVVGKNDFGEWDRLGPLVRAGSKAYLEALETPGVALLHKSGEVEEGNQDAD